MSKPATKTTPASDLPPATDDAPWMIDATMVIPGDDAGDDSIAFEIEAADGGESDGPKTFKARCYGGGPMNPRVNGAARATPTIIDLAGVTVDRGGRKLPVLYRHDQSTPIGHTTRVDVGSTAITAEGVLSVPCERRDEVVGAAREGYRWGVSVGIAATDVEYLGERETKRVNGRTVRGPAYIARKGWMRELSLLSIGAEATAAATVSATSGDLSPLDHAAMKKDLREYIEAQGFTATQIESLAPKQVEYFEAQFEASKTPADSPQTPAHPSGTPVDDVEAADGGLSVVEQMRADAAAERKRISRVTEICAEFKDPSITVEGVTGPVSQFAIEAGWSDEQTELRALRASRPAAPSIHSTNRGETHSIEAVTAGLLMRAGVDLESDALRGVEAIEAGMPDFITAGVNDERFQRAAEAGRKFRGVSMIQACQHAVHAITGNMPVHRSEIIEAAFSTNQIADIFGTGVGARTLIAFRESVDTTTGWTRTTTVPDFLEHERVGLDAMGGLDHLAAGDTATLASRKSKMEKVQAARYAKQYTIDDQDLINDRLDLINGTPRAMGAAAARLRPDLAYFVLLSNPTMLRTTRPAFNVTDGTLMTAAAFGRESLSAAIASLMKQKDGDANLNLQPTHILSGPELADEIVQLTGSAVLSNDSGAGARNPMARYGLTPVADARISNGVVHPQTGTTAAGSATAFYVLSTDADTVEIQTVDGTGGVPMVRTTMLDRGQWGWNIDVKYDIGAKLVENRTIRQQPGV